MMSRLAITLTLAVALTIVHHALSIDVDNMCKCGIENKVPIQVATRIIGGKGVPAGKYPWMVLVGNLADGGDCTGAIINDKYVLTASHCVDRVTCAGCDMEVYHDLKHSNMKSIWKGKPLKVANVTKLERDGRPAKKDDIALLELKYKLNFTKTFSPICLTPEIKHNNYFAAGWGVQQAATYVDGKIQKAKPSKADRVLSEIPLTSIPDEECSKKRNTDYQMCVQGLKEGGFFSKEVKSNVCSGDSGGPLMTRGKDGEGKERVYTVGIASSSDCNAITKSATYEKIIAHKQWIKDNTKGAWWCEGSSDFFREA